MERLKYQIKQFIHIFIPLKYIESVSIFKEKNVNIVSVFPSEKFNLPKLNDVFGNEYNNCNNYEVKIPEIFTFEIKKGIVITGNEEVYTSDGNVFKEITTLKENFQVNKFKSKLKKNRKYLKGIICYLDTSTELNNNYCHFVLETLPRLYIILKSGIIPDYYILPGNQKFHLEFYAKFGIDPKKIIIMKPNTIIQSENLIITTLLNNWDYISYRNFTFSKRLWIPIWIKDTYANYLPNINVQNEKRIYISRKMATNRHIANEDEIINIVKEHHFEVVILENLSVSEKINLFKSAKLIVSIHGAGLGNLLFCNPETTVFEIISRDYLDSHFRMISHNMGLDYHYIVGEPIITEELTPVTEDLYLNPTLFKQSLENLICGIPSTI
jgi:hypothetical protein